MAYRVEASRLVPVDAETAFARVADVRNHPRWVPLTRFGQGPTAAPRPGEPFTMVSGPGARRGLPGVADRMVITELVEPSSANGTVGRAVVRKNGPVLLGVAGFDVVPVDAARSRVVWWEEARLAGPWPRRANASAVGAFLRPMMRLTLRRLARELTRELGAPG